MTNTKIKCLSDDKAKALRAEVMAKLDYDALTGGWWWRFGPNVAAKVRGTKAGHVQKAGYLTIRLGGRLFYAQRLAWLVTYGVWPKVAIEFVDRNKVNTAIANLIATSKARTNTIPVQLELFPLDKDSLISLHEDETED